MNELNEEQVKTNIIDYILIVLKGKPDEFIQEVISGVHGELNDMLQASNENENDENTA